MPRQNRVTPFGEIIAVPDRGMFMGNRDGCLHAPDGQLRKKRWCSKRWITCLLEFGGQRWDIKATGGLTWLFFLDEATALSAGHRPCSRCRRKDKERFVQAWLAGNPDLRPERTFALDHLDDHLHAERVQADKSKRVYGARLGDLPDGTMVALQAGDDTAWLKWRGKLRRWTSAGYDGGRPADEDMSVVVLTPKSTVMALAAGYSPQVHDSASL